METNYSLRNDSATNSYLFGTITIAPGVTHIITVKNVSEETGKFASDTDYVDFKDAVFSGFVTVSYKTQDLTPQNGVNWIGFYYDDPEHAVEMAQFAYDSDKLDNLEGEEYMTEAETDVLIEEHNTSIDAHDDIRTELDDKLSTVATDATLNGDGTTASPLTVVGGGGGAYLPLAGGVMSGNIGRTAHNVGHLVGGFDDIGNNATKTNPIYTIGSSHNPNSDDLADMYGVGYTHYLSSFINSNANSWGMYVADEGAARVFLGASAGGNSYFNTTGNFGIGIDDPHAKLHVKGNALFSNASGLCDTWFPFGLDGSNYITGDKTIGTGQASTHIRNFDGTAYHSTAEFKSTGQLELSNKGTDELLKLKGSSPFLSYYRDDGISHLGYIQFATDGYLNINPLTGAKTTRLHGNNVDLTTGASITMRGFPVIREEGVAGQDIYGNIRVLQNVATNTSCNDGIYLNYGSTGGTKNEIKFFSGSANTTERLKLNYNGDLVMADNGSLWIGSTTGHRLRLHHASSTGDAYIDYKDRLHFRPDGQSSNEIYFGTYGQAVINYSNGTDYSLTQSTSLTVGRSGNHGSIRIYGQSTNEWSLIQTSTNNLHMDSGANGNMYLNYYNNRPIYGDGAGRIANDNSTYSSSWVTLSGSSIQYCKRAGIVFLRGQQNGDYVVSNIMPVGFRPAITFTQRVQDHSGSGMARMYINYQGLVSFTTTGGYYDVDGLSYPAER